MLKLLLLSRGFEDRGSNHIFLSGLGRLCLHLAI